MGRIFWLGMHKVLKPTELRRLRGLGFEVFNPAYISPVYDQSADRTIDLDQPSTLPAEIFKRLIEYDFFYRPIEQEIAEILNAYFDTVIVTISADWLLAIAKAFHGRLIYRVYGQHFLLSDKIIDIDAWGLLSQRTNFSVVPFAQESVEYEHGWFRNRIAAIVPYQIPDDVFEYAGRWGHGSREQIATSIPNMQNPYFNEAYQRFNGRFPESFFRIYGPQRAHPADRRIVNTLPRQVFFDSLRASSGYYYDYADSVCYLPPIESMQIGVPVVCAAGSLLAEFFAHGAPNVVEDAEEAREKLALLLKGDAVLAAELKAAQEPVRRRYDRDVVAEVFDREFGRILRAPAEQRPPPARPIVSSLSDRSRILIPLHVDGLFRHRYGRVYAFEGIPRVVDAIVRAVTKTTTLGVLISCTPGSLPALHDFFEDQIAEGLVRLEVIEGLAATPFEQLTRRMDFCARIEKDPLLTSVLVPHYYLFPEMMMLEKRLVLYLPDYFPHMTPGVIYDVSEEKDRENKAIGVALANQAAAVLTNSNFTKRYLPDAGFTASVDEEKVVVVPLPFLGSGRSSRLSSEETALIRDRVGRRAFIFYPTANRPNKRLDFLFDVYDSLLQIDGSLGLVLTCSLHTHMPALERANQLGILDRITFMPHASEGVLRWLYENTTMLCFTSILEGNFPPQVLEALNYGAPVVATRLPTITEILGPVADKLLLCDALDHDDFVAKARIAIERRDEVLDRQEQVRRLLLEWNSEEAFVAGLERALPEMSGRRRVDEGAIRCA